MSINSYVCEDALGASAACARKMLDLLEERLASESTATLAVSGGSTPKLLFDELAKKRFDWSRVHLFWVDERGVPPADPQSNYKLAKDHFIDPARFPSRNVHRIQAELEPHVAAHLYADEIGEFFGIEAGKFPLFDIIHRGMGPDAHTASLFPGEPLIDDHENLVAAVYVEKFHQWRITLLGMCSRRLATRLCWWREKTKPSRCVQFCTSRSIPRNIQYRLGLTMVVT